MSSNRYRGAVWIAGILSAFRIRWIRFWRLSRDVLLDWDYNWFCLRVLCRFCFRVHFKRRSEGLVVMERGISIMDNEVLPLIGFSGGALQGLPAFFFLVNDLDVGILGKGQPGTGASLESVSAPLQSLPSLQKLEDDGPEIGIGGSFTGGQGAQGENVDRHAHDLYFNNKLVDLTTDMLFNSLVSRKGEAQGTVTPKASLLTPNFSQRGATDMLSPVKGVYQHAQVFFPLTPSAGAVINLPLTRPGSLSLPEEVCDFCDSRAVEEVVSYTGDEEHIQFLCGHCWLMGFSPEAEEVAA